MKGFTVETRVTPASIDVTNSDLPVTSTDASDTSETYIILKDGRELTTTEFIFAFSRLPRSRRPVA